MQEIEGIEDEPHFAFAVGRRLSLGEARQSGVVHATKLAVQIGSFRVQVRERFGDARIFASPVKPSSCQQLRTAVLDARSRTIAVELDLMDPLRPRWRRLD